MIAVLSGMSQVLVQFVDQYIQLAGSSATVKQKEDRRRRECGYCTLNS